VATHRHYRRRRRHRLRHRLQRHADGKMRDDEVEKRHIAGGTDDLIITVTREATFKNAELFRRKENSNSCCIFSVFLQSFHIFVTHSR